MKDSLGYDVKEKKARRDYLEYRQAGWSHTSAMRKIRGRYYAR